MQRAQKGGCAASRPHWHLSVALPRVEICLAEERQGAANNPRKGPAGCSTPKGWWSWKNTPSHGVRTAGRKQPTTPCIHAECRRALEKWPSGPGRPQSTVVVRSAKK